MAAARMCHRRWQTMHNRWCCAAKPAESGNLTIIRRRRCRTMLCHFEAHYYWCHLSAGCALVGLPAVKHGQAPSALVVLSLSAASAPSALCVRAYVIRPARVLRHPLHAAMSPERRDPEGESRRDLAVGERSVTHGPPTLPKPASGQDANYLYR